MFIRRKRYSRISSVLFQGFGLAGDNVSVIFKDIEDNVWLGFNGDGLSMLTNDAFKFFVPGKEDEPKSIIFVGSSGSDYLLGHHQDSILSIRDWIFRPVHTVSGQAGKVEIASFFSDDENNVWIGTKATGLYVRNPAGRISRFFRSGDSGADYIVNITVAGNNIWLSTLNGVIIISKEQRRNKEIIQYK